MHRVIPHKLCVIPHTVCNFTQSFYFNKECVILHWVKTFIPRVHSWFALFEIYVKQDNVQLCELNHIWGYVARIISSQKIYGLYGLKHQILEISGYVTDAGRTDKQTKREDSATQLWICETLSFATSFFLFFLLIFKLPQSIIRTSVCKTNSFPHICEMFKWEEKEGPQQDW